MGVYREGIQGTLCILGAPDGKVHIGGFDAVQMNVTFS